MRTKPVCRTVTAATLTSLMSFTALLTPAITGGLALVLTDGGHRPVPGFATPRAPFSRTNSTALGFGTWKGRRAREADFARTCSYSWRPSF